MKWIGTRISFVDKKDSISFVIYPPKIGYKRTIIVVWFVLWLLIGGYVTSRFFLDYTREEKLVLFVFMAFWFYFSFKVLKTILYLYFGKELIKLDKENLLVKQSTWNYGKTNRYFIENITKFNLDIPKESSIKKVYEDSPWIMGSNRIQFDYYHKKYSFGRKLSEKDAEMVFKIMTKRIERFLRSKK